MKNLYIAGTAFLVTLFTGVANAALDPAVTQAYTDVETDGLALLGLAWPVIAVFVGAFVVIKLFKRTTAKI